MYHVRSVKVTVKKEKDRGRPTWTTVPWGPFWARGPCATLNLVKTETEVFSIVKPPHQPPRIRQYWTLLNGIPDGVGTLVPPVRKTPKVRKAIKE